MRTLILSALLSCLSFAATAQTDYDAEILEYTGLKYPCDGGATPVVIIKNIGTQTMSGCVVETWKNGLQVNSFDWQLAVPALTGQTRQPTLPAVPNVQLGDELEFRIISVNTIPDEDPNGNILSVELDQAPASAFGGDMEVEIALGEDPGSVTWSVKNDLNVVVASGGPYEDANSVVTEDINLPSGGCYTFYAEDALRSVAASSVKVKRDGNTLIHIADLSSLYSKGLTTGSGGGCTNDLEFTITTDALGSENRWEIVVQGTEAVVCTGGPYTDEAQTLSEMCCLPDGCYLLRVYDNGGDGIAGGGYVLRTAGGQRIIDNTGNFYSGSFSAISNNEGFCLPLGTDRFIYTSCDKLDWRNYEYIVANPSTSVTLNYGVNNANSGYQIWFFDPNGGYSFRRFQSHNTANGMPLSATRACHFRINGWSGNQLQETVLYNVRVRGRANGTYAEWGPACRMKWDTQRAQCPLTKLMDVPGNIHFSCGSSRDWGGSSRIVARPVARVTNNGSQNANKYQFRFRLQDGTLVTTRTSNNYFLTLNWSPNALVQGTTYNVDVRASFDNGATWCTDFIAPALTDPWGDVCTLTINGGGGGELRISAEGAEDTERMLLYPNPNDGGDFMLQLPAGVDLGTWIVDVHDLTGKRVNSTRATITDNSGTVVLRSMSLVSGMYIVSATNGEVVLTERLVVRP